MYRQFARSGYVCAWRALFGVNLNVNKIVGIVRRFWRRVERTWSFDIACYEVMQSILDSFCMYKPADRQNYERTDRQIENRCGAMRYYGWHEGKLWATGLLILHKKQHKYCSTVVNAKLFPVVFYINRLGSWYLWTAKTHLPVDFYRQSLRIMLHGMVVKLENEFISCQKAVHLEKFEYVNLCFGRML